MDRILRQTNPMLQQHAMQILRHGQLEFGSGGDLRDARRLLGCVRACTAQNSEAKPELPLRAATLSRTAIPAFSLVEVADRFRPGRQDIAEKGLRLGRAVFGGSPGPAFGRDEIRLGRPGIGKQPAEAVGRCVFG